MNSHDSLTEFGHHIAREGGIWSLFGLTGVTSAEAPAEIRDLVTEANRHVQALNPIFDAISEACGLDE